MSLLRMITSEAAVVQEVEGSNPNNGEILLQSLHSSSLQIQANTGKKKTPKK